MKNLILLFFALILSQQSFSQDFTKDWYDAFKNDNLEFAQKNVTDDNLNDCFLVKGSPYSLLSVAIKLDAENIFTFLVEKKANLNKVCTAKTPSMYAVKYGKLEMLKTLVENKADLTISNSGQRAIDYARKYKQVEIEKYLKNLKSN